MQIDKKNTINQYALIAGIIAMFIAVGMYAWLGSFSRYIADDYCEAIRVNSSSPFQAVIERYTSEDWPRPTVRYSNLFFVGLSELIGNKSIPITIFAIPLLWTIGLIFCIHEVRKLFRIKWHFSFDIFLGLILAFFSLLQAPNLFQTIYWRSAMMTHFGPLIFGSFFLPALIKCIRLADQISTTIFASPFLLFGAFIFAGFSEPPTTTVLTILPISICITWLLGNPEVKHRQVMLLGITLLGVLIGFFTMLLSPASVNATQGSQSTIIQVLIDSFFYSYLFIIDSFKTQPLPILISTLIPFLLIWLHQQERQSELSSNQKKTTWIIIVTIPVLTWLLIAASFSPSVYGQSFPIERARFLARVLMITALMLEGGLFGFLTQRIQFKPNPAIGQWIALSLLTFISVVYPLRTAYYMAIYDLPEYRERARLWDLRDAFIKRHAAQGETDLVVPGFSGIYGIKEVDDNPSNWINICVAEFYGVNSIRAIGVDNLEEILNE